MISNKEIPAIFLTFIIVLGGLAVIGAVKAQQNPFEISTEQSDQQATITIKLATNNTVVIPPNGTVIEVPGNITQVDNDTVVISPANETITELPGNVTVITPPEPEPCTCPLTPVENATTPIIGPVVVRPAPGQEVITENGTELVANESQEEPIPIPENETTIVLEPTQPQQGNETEDTNSSSSDNQTGNEFNDSNNNTALAPAALSQILPWWQA